MQKTQMILTKPQKKTEIEIFAFCVTTFELIKIQTSLTPQNEFCARWQKNAHKWS